MIHNLLLTHIQAALQAALIDDVAAADPARASVIKLGYLQGDPEPDAARISIELHLNDPDDIEGSGIESAWQDEVVEVEVGAGGPTATWRRCFTVKGRCLLVETQEDLDAALLITAIVRARLEAALATLSFAGVIADNGEFISRGVTATTLHGRIYQAGGPPDAYDFHIKVRFDVLSTQPPGG